MIPPRKLNRRSFLASVGGGAVTGGGSLLLFGSSAGAAQITDCDTGAGADPIGRGTGLRCRRDTQPQQPQTGITDCDGGQGADPAGRGTGLRCRSGQQQPQTGITDCDAGQGADPAGRGTGLRCRSGQQQPQTGITDCDSGQGADPGGRGTGRTPCGSQIRARLDCVPLSINRAELPSRTCNIVITGFRRNTADPVEVILPNATDGYGNHANGIQVTGAGSQSVFNWDSSYNWGLFIFACASQRGTGANCYGNNAAVGPFSVPIVVRQNGAGEARLSLTGTINPHPTNDPGGPNQPNVGAQGTVRIQNRWRADQFINIEIGLGSSAIQPQWASALWRIEPGDSGFVRIGNVWQPDRYLHMESGRLEATPIQAAWWSAMWALEPVDSGFVRIRNRWHTDQYLHTENGQLSAGQIRPEWWSAMWRLTPA